MKRKTILKIVIDIGMTVMLLFLMAYERSAEQHMNGLELGCLVFSLSTTF